MYKNIFNNMLCNQYQKNEYERNISVNDDAELLWYKLHPEQTGRVEEYNKENL